MKVVYFFRSLAIWGGIERIIVDKANWLAANGCQVHILTCDQGQHPVPYAVDEVVGVEDLKIGLHRQYRYRGLSRLWMAWRLNRLLVSRLHARMEQLRPDVIVVVTSSYADLAIKACRGVAPVVVESHSIYLETFNDPHPRVYFHSWKLKFLLKNVQAIVALTDEDACEWRRHYQNVYCIPNMVSLNTSDQRGRWASHRVIFVGRFDNQKRTDIAIRIWERIHPRFPDWELHIYGHGERQQMVYKVAEKASGVVVHEPTNQIIDAYCNSSFLILTSSFEPFGLVMPEAMSCGLPVVAFDCAYGPRHIITDGTDGFVVPLDDEQAFADGMMQLMGNEALCQHMGKEAIRSSQRYAANRVMLQWQQLFQQLVGEHGK